jgi:hypothetical protein
VHTVVVVNHCHVHAAIHPLADFYNSMTCRSCTCTPCKPQLLKILLSTLLSNELCANKHSKHIAGEGSKSAKNPTLINRLLGRTSVKERSSSPTEGESPRNNNRAGGGILQPTGEAAGCCCYCALVTYMFPCWEVDVSAGLKNSVWEASCSPQVRPPLE